MCVVPAVVPFVAVSLRDFLAVVARRPLWRLPGFFVAAGAPDSGDGRLLSSTVFVFLGTDGSGFNNFNSFIAHPLLGKCFLAVLARSAKLAETWSG